MLINCNNNMKNEYTPTTFRFSDDDEKLIEKIMLEKSFKTKNKTVKFCLAFYNEQYPALVKMNEELENKLDDLNMSGKSILTVSSTYNISSM